MAKQPKFEVGNQVYVKLHGGGHGDTLYEITKLATSGYGCMIREYRSKPPFYAEQWFDTSLLVHAVTDEMLAAFSLGPLKATRR